MLTLITSFNLISLCFFTVCYSYQIFYTLLSIARKPKEYHARKMNTYAVIISARNESSVIAHLIESIKKQHYPQELIDIYVVADNCTDNTAQVAKKAGAFVFERFNDQLRGKGYALDYAFKRILSSEKQEKYDGYFVFDADNLLDSNYIAEMNKVFDNGYQVVTSYRNSKNYDTNWISAGYSLWFLREARQLNHSRMMLNTSCAISGTGFLIHKNIIKKNNGWKHHLLTEDIEFSVDSVIHGEKIGYSNKAILYDEQPTKFSQSWYQRLRWSKGFYQVFMNYGGKLLKGIFKNHSFACYDLFMTIAPAIFISLITVFANTVFLLVGLCCISVQPEVIHVAVSGIFSFFFNYYFFLFIFGLIATITEWKKIHCKAHRKILYLFTFPIFIFTYVPIAIVALFKKVEWVPISHTITKTIEEV